MYSARSGLYVVVLLTLGGCDPAPVSSDACLSLRAYPGEVVAQVGSRAITDSELRRRIEDKGALGARRFSDLSAIRALLDDRIRFELLVYAARERQLDRDPDVIDAAHNVMVRKLIQQDIRSDDPERGPTDAQISRYYERYKNDYQQPAKRRFAHIQLAPTEEGRALAESFIGELGKRTEPRELFRKLAAKRSLDTETRRRGGEVLFSSQDELTTVYGKTFAGDVFAAPLARVVAEPVPSIRGWHVVYVLAQRDTLVRSLDSVRGEIKERLLKRKRTDEFDAYLEEIRQRYPVAVYEDRLRQAFGENKEP